MKGKEDTNISCHIFQNQEQVLRNITDRINNAQGVQEKGKFAGELQEEVGVLLSCPDYNKGKLECKNCHFIANLRKKTANLIMKAEKLAK